MESARPKIAILGAGPTGLVAALAAAEAGFPFALFEAAAGPAGYVRGWGHVRLFTPWEMSVSPRVRRRLQEAGASVPSDGSCPLGHELCERVLEPLAELPEIAPAAHWSTRVVAVSRDGLLKNEQIGTGERSRSPFRLLLEGPDGRRIEHANIIFDCTGTWGHPNALGDGGIPCPGEEELTDRIDRYLPDLDLDSSGWAGRRVLLVGAGHSGQTAARDLAALAEATPETHILWALRSATPDFSIPGDSLPERAALTRAATAIAHGGSPAVEPLVGVVEALAPAGAAIRAVLRSTDGRQRTVEVDRILSLTGAVGDHGLYRQLQVHECWATSGPMRLAAALLGSNGGDCLTQTSRGVDTLRNPEPGFFILGAKSYGRNPTFLMRVGWEQVDEVIGLLTATGADSLH